jgi:hypothetical protein
MDRRAKGLFVGLLGLTRQAIMAWLLAIRGMRLDGALAFQWFMAASGIERRGYRSPKRVEQNFFRTLLEPDLAGRPSRWRRCKMRRFPSHRPETDRRSFTLDSALVRFNSREGWTTGFFSVIQDLARDFQTRPCPRSWFQIDRRRRERLDTRCPHESENVVDFGRWRVVDERRVEPG